MNIVERLVGDVTIIDLQGKIMIGEVQPPRGSYIRM